MVNGETNKKRYKIIEPFIKGDKKLKEIENESGVSYATLKRWVKSYKENGITGLKKKTRKDKSFPRNISNTTFQFIKKTYEKNPNIKVTSLYQKCKNFLKDIQGESISYNTVYRIVNNLDSFIQNHAELHIEKIKKKNQAYRMTSIEIDIILEPNKNNNKPLLYICYDVATLEILNYKLSLDPFELSSSLLFLRDTLLKVQERNDENILIESFIIESFKIKDFKLINKIKSSTGITIYNSFNKVNEIERFSTFLSQDILKIVNFSNNIFNLNSLDDLIFSYIYMSDKEYSTNYIPSIRSPLEESLDIFLETSKRNVQEYGIRFKNVLYKNNKLKSKVGTSVTIKYDSLNLNHILVFIEDKYYCSAYSI